MSEQPIGTWPQAERYDPELIQVLRDINAGLREISEQLGRIIMSQSDIDAAATALTGAAATLGTVAADLQSATANITAEIAALKTANPGVDTTALNEAVAGLAAPLAALNAADTAVDALEVPPGLVPARRRGTRSGKWLAAGRERIGQRASLPSRAGITTSRPPACRRTPGSR